MKIEILGSGCKKCKVSLKENGTYCERHCTIFHINHLITFGTQAQNNHRTNKKLEAIEYFTKAIALGIIFLIENKELAKNTKLTKGKKEWIN